MKVFYTKTADIIGYKVQSRLKNPKMPLYFAILTQITFQFDFLDSAYFSSLFSQVQKVS